MKDTFPIKTDYGEFRAKIKYSTRDGVYYVSAPAFPGVLTDAGSMIEAKRFAREIIELQCLSAFDDGKLVIDDMSHVYGSRRLIRPGALAVA
jgi:predicted RNase H-like HicB family nuclease